MIRKTSEPIRGLFVHLLFMYQHRTDEIAEHADTLADNGIGFAAQLRRMACNHLGMARMSRIFDDA